MSWANLDDGFADHPKVIDLPDAAFRLHVCAMCWCSRRLTDGLVRSRELRILGAMLEGCPDDEQLRELVKKLVKARLWESCEEGWRLHDWLKHNESASKVTERREAAKQRMAENRRKAAEKSRTFADSSREHSDEHVPERAGEVRSPSPLLSSPLPNPTEEAKASSLAVGLAPPPPTPTPTAPSLPGLDPGMPKKPSKAPRAKSATASNPAIETLAVGLLAELSEAIRRVRPTARTLKPLESNLAHIRDRLIEGHSADDVRHVIAIYEAEAQHNPTTLHYFGPVTPFRAENFARTLPRTLDDARRRTGNRTGIDPSIGERRQSDPKTFGAWRDQ